MTLRIERQLHHVQDTTRAPAPRLVIVSRQVTAAPAPCRAMRHIHNVHRPFLKVTSGGLRVCD
jgi:hypothetical protein